MSVIVFTAPYVPPPPPPNPWAPFTSTWIGPGSTEPISLNDPANGIVMLAAGVLGLHLPAYDRYTSESPAMAGARFRGSRAKSRDVEWPIFVFSDTSSAEWVERDRRFWDSLDTDLPGTWTVAAPGGERRSLQCRLVSDGGHVFDLNPGRFGWQIYQVQLIADAPFWVGEPISDSWEEVSPEPFIPDDGAPPFNITSSASTNGATMSNPGDVAAWPVWTMTAVTGAVEVTATVDGGTISTPSIPEGSTLIIDTDPAQGTAYLDGIDVSGEIDPWDPRPIPAGQDVPIEILMTGFGTVTASIAPRYRRGI